MNNLDLPELPPFIFDEEQEIDKITARSLLDRLDKREKELIIMWMWYGYTTQEIADYVSITYPSKNKKKSITAMAIRTRIRQIIKKLQKHVNIRT